MNKGIIIAGIVILILVGGGLYIANRNSQQAEQAKMAQEKAAMKAKESFDNAQDKDAAMKEKQDKEVVIKKDEGIMQKSDDKVMADKNSASRYVEYSKLALDQAASNRRVLYFYASWCPICLPTDANLKENTSKIPEDLTVIRVNYNDPETDQEEKDLAKKYGITYQHTFVQIDSQGKEVTKWNGGQIEELLAKIK